MTCRHAALLVALLAVPTLSACKTTVTGGANGDTGCPEGATRGCEMDDGTLGSEECAPDQGGALQWQECSIQPCDPDTEVERDCITGTGEDGRELCATSVATGDSYWGGCRPEPTDDCPYGGNGGGYPGCGDTPLVLSFDSAPVEYTTEMAGAFDLTGLGVSRATDWPTSATPWLALDRDGNGAIDDGGELFGSATKLSDGSFAVNGFAALRALDDNADGTIDASDAAFARLSLWADRDASRSSAPGELTPASSRLVSIALDYTSSPTCDARGNCEIERATFRYRDAAGAPRTGTIVDIHLRAQR